jgi:hypothetical protein
MKMVMPPLSGQTGDAIRGIPKSGAAASVMLYEHHRCALSRMHCSSVPNSQRTSAVVVGQHRNGVGRTYAWRASLARGAHEYCSQHVGRLRDGPVQRR